MSVAGGDWLQDFPWLQGLETPFAWAPTDLLPPSEAPGFIAHLMRKRQKMADAEEVFNLNMFVLNLVTCYEWASSGNISAAILKLHELEGALNGFDIVSNCSFYRQGRRALWHVTVATGAVLMAHNGSLDESRQLVGDNFVPLSVLNEVELASLYGIKSTTFLQYGARGGAEALRWAKQAIYKNPKEPEWHLLAGQSLEAIRRGATPAPEGLPAEELAHFEQAVVLSVRPTHALCLARVYSRLVRDTHVSHVHDPLFKNSPLALQMAEASRRTVQLYQKALELAPNCTETQIACLEGMLKLPRQYLSNDQLRDLVEAISASPNKSVAFYNAAATFYLKIERSNQPALRLFDEGAERGDYACAINALRLRVKLRHDVDAELTLLGLERRLRNGDRAAHETALAHLTGFYLLKDHNLELALENGNRILESNPASKALLVHRPVFVRSLKPLNLLMILLNEVRAADVVPGRASAPAHLREIFMKLVARHYPDLLRRPVDVHMVDKLIDASDRLGKKQNRPRKFTSDRYYPYS